MSLPNPDQKLYHLLPFMGILVPVKFKNQCQIRDKTCIKINNNRTLLILSELKIFISLKETTYFLKSSLYLCLSRVIFVVFQGMSAGLEKLVQKRELATEIGDIATPERCFGCNIPKIIAKI